ncbi:MAG: hypothetical protein GOV15_01605, partial [Candidatus Diapherotrites archaeon]|nr:hypothetical protein [Candidatus Diapherotrites archaeon]
CSKTGVPSQKLAPLIAGNLKVLGIKRVGHTVIEKSGIEYPVLVFQHESTSLSHKLSRKSALERGKKFRRKELFETGDGV